MKEGYTVGQTDRRGEWKGETHKQFDVTPCIRLVALLIAQGPHFYSSRSVLRRSLPSTRLM